MSSKKTNTWICVFFKNAPAWRARGHTHWFVCKKCLRAIAKGSKDWRVTQ